jgi:hypothetical protein
MNAVTDTDNCVSLAYSDGTVVRWQMARTEVDLLADEQPLDLDFETELRTPHG